MSHLAIDRLPLVEHVTVVVEHITVVVEHVTVVVEHVTVVLWGLNVANGAFEKRGAHTSR